MTAPSVRTGGKARPRGRGLLVKVHATTVNRTDCQGAHYALARALGADRVLDYTAEISPTTLNADNSKKR
jgi:NADPH:quinone reductase-like Zn-dependent oxidoreductase